MYTINEKRLIINFIELAKISSPSWHEHKVIEYITKKMKQIKVPVKKLKAGKSFNLLIKVPGTLNKKNQTPLLFAAHMDTVTPCENIKIVETKTKIATDGKTILGSDDKAGVAAIMETIYYLKENKLEHRPIEILFTCAEEVGLCGIKNFNFSNVKSKTAFVLDSDGPIGTATLQAPFHTTMKINITGKAAHAGVEPEKGISAINILSEIITKFPKGRIDKETTLNVGTISGGKANNIVAEKANMTLEIRSLNKEKLKKLETKVKNIINTTTKKYKAKSKIDSTLEYSGYQIKTNDTLIKSFENAATKIKIKPIYEASGGGSDTNIFNANKVKAINLSIGMTNVHTTKEFVLKKDLIKGTKLLVSLIATL